MAQLTKEQMQKLNDDLKNGTILATIHNSRYHLIVKVNAEGIIIQSMLAEDNDMGILLNLGDIRKEFDNKTKEKQYEKNTESNSGSV